MADRAGLRNDRRDVVRIRRAVEIAQVAGDASRAQPGVLPIDVACGAFSAVGAARELVAVRIRCVTVRALGVSQGLLEVSAVMTREAGYASVFAKQRENRAAVIELRGAAQLFPTGGVVAGLAAGGKRSFVRVRVARSTFVKGKPVYWTV